MRSLNLALLALVASGCGNPAPPKATDPKELVATLETLATFPEKRVGTAGGRQAGEYVMERMRKIGLTGLKMESFRFPRHQVTSSSLSLTNDGAASAPAHDVFEGSGGGHADAEVVYVGIARPENLTNVDLTGKVALVERSRDYHRSAQYANVSAKGAAAMLYLSVAPENLIQIGSVRTDTWKAIGAIPAITVGAVDGAPLKAAAEAKKLRAVIDVQVMEVPSDGNNVIGRIEGSEAGAEIVIGAHYDTWFIGSCDNGGGVAALLALAERRARGPKPRYTLVFVAYDGEEVALYGGYDYLRKHRVVTQDPILAVINFEMPAAFDSTLLGLGRSNHAALDEALIESGLGFTYPLYVGLEVVPMLLGGLIPTDIQGIYRSGVPTVTTAVDSPWYHTARDTPDKVDVKTLGEVVDQFDVALGLLLKNDRARFAGLDPQLWRADVALSPPVPPTAPILADITVTNAVGEPQAGAQVDAVLLVDDFFGAGNYTGKTDATGKVRFTIPATAFSEGSGNRYLHVSAGPTYPFVERVIALQ
jgi:aminopeptidase YwaD